MPEANQQAVPKPRSQRTQYVPAVGPRLRILLLVVLTIVAILAVNSAYLGGVTALESITGQTFQNHFYLYMFLVHLGMGFVVIIPFIAFGLIHLLKSRTRKNRRAIRVGYGLFGVCITLLTTGVLLVQVEGLFELKNPMARSIAYWMHVAAPFVAAWLFWLHRLAGRRINWRLGMRFAGLAGVVVIVMIILQAQDPRDWGRKGPAEGKKYFHPSFLSTASGNFMTKRSLMNDEYCLKCHQDAYKSWFHSAHHFSSFNNPTYLSSIKEVRDDMLKRDGHVKSSRWCAGCHDPVPFLSGEFDDPNYDIVAADTAHAGITCTVCHAITHVNSPRGNADFTIAEPLHYPFAYSKNKTLQWINQQLVKAKPSFHKRSMLKPFHKKAEFCSTCHKVHLPKELTNYKDFLRGQNHYDPFLLSGVSGVGARSFYYPPKAEQNCNGCHMPLLKSNDFAANYFGGGKDLSIHSHMFVGANTAIGWFEKNEEAIRVHQDFLKGVMRVDIFGIKEGGAITGKLHAPLRPSLPTLEPGEAYLLETVIRTVKMGHLFTQGTVDSNEVWLDVTLKAGERVIGRSGDRDEKGEVDRYAHFVNVFMLDRQGERINRRNAHDIFTPLYNHQIPPGAGQTVHYSFIVPKDIDAPLTIELKLNYRKFDQEFMDLVAKSADELGQPIRGYEKGKVYINKLPITVLATDTVTLPVRGVKVEVPPNQREPVPEALRWQRWNDYGIGLLLKKGRAELKQAAGAFRQIRQTRYDGWLNLARVKFSEGDLVATTKALNEAAKFSAAGNKAPPWTMSWLSGRVNRQNGHLDEAEQNFRDVLATKVPARLFDFSRDYVVNNLLGLTIYDLATKEVDEGARQQRLLEARDVYLRTREIDPENVEAHFKLDLIYRDLGDVENADKHRRLHERYRSDDNAADRVVQIAQARYPAAKEAAKAVAIYPLQRKGAPGLNTENRGGK